MGAEQSSESQSGASGIGPGSHIAVEREVRVPGTGGVVVLCKYQHHAIYIGTLRDQQDEQEGKPSKNRGQEVIEFSSGRLDTDTSSAVIRLVMHPRGAAPARSRHPALHRDV